MYFWIGLLTKESACQYSSESFRFSKQTQQNIVTVFVPSFLPFLSAHLNLK